MRGANREFNLSGIREAEFSVRSARRSLYLTRVRTVLDAVGAAYEVVRQRTLVRLNEESAERLGRHARAARAKEKIGLAGPIDSYRAGIQLREAEDTLTTAREDYRDALDDLKIILALPQEEPMEVEAPLTYDLVEITGEEAVGMALSSRVELEQAVDLLGEAERRSRIARHNILPDLNLALNYSRFGVGDRFGESTGFDRDLWGVSLVTSTDLTRTEEKIAFEQSRIDIRGAERNFSLSRDQVVREVRRELRSLRRSGQRISIQEEQIAQARGQLELARVKFRRGLTDNFDLVDAESQLRNAETNLLSVVLEYIVGTYRLRAAMGTLVEKQEEL